MSHFNNQDINIIFNIHLFSVSISFFLRKQLKLEGAYFQLLNCVLYSIASPVFIYIVRAHAHTFTSPPPPPTHNLHPCRNRLAIQFFGGRFPYHSLEFSRQEKQSRLRQPLEQLTFHILSINTFHI